MTNLRAGKDMMWWLATMATIVWRVALGMTNSLEAKEPMSYEEGLVMTSFFRS